MVIARGVGGPRQMGQQRFANDSGAVVVEVCFDEEAVEVEVEGMGSRGTSMKMRGSSSSSAVEEGGGLYLKSGLSSKMSRSDSLAVGHFPFPFLDGESSALSLGPPARDVDP